MWFSKERKFGKGAVVEPIDNRDLIYDNIASGSEEFDWEKGYDIESDLNIKINFEDQGKSSSCVGQAWSYYGSVIDAKETGVYSKQSAKAIYSQIYLPNGGAYIREGAKLFVNWGSLPEEIISSYEDGKAPSEDFIRDRDWKTENADTLAEMLKAKEYRGIVASNNIDLFAMAIRDNLGVVSGVNGENNGTWSTLEPKPPTNVKWGHALYFGKAGIDKKGKYIATPNSWGDIYGGQWQKLREDYFTSGHMFNPWTLTDKLNNDMGKFRLIQQEGEKAVWFVGQDGKRRFFFDEDQYKAIAPILGLSIDFSELETISKEAMELVPIEKPIIVIK